MSSLARPIRGSLFSISRSFLYFSFVSRLEFRLRITLMLFISGRLMLQISIQLHFTSYIIGHCMIRTGAIAMRRQDVFTSEYDFDWASSTFQIRAEKSRRYFMLILSYPTDTFEFATITRVLRALDDYTQLYFVELWLFRIAAARHVISTTKEEFLAAYWISPEFWCGDIYALPL